MRWLLVFLFVLPLIASIPSVTVAQEVELRQGEERPSPRIMLVIDVSGSMKDSRKIERAVDWALNNVVLSATDDIEIGVITFNGSPMRHLDESVDKDGNKVTKEWFKLPAAPVLERIRERLKALGASGMTVPDEAVKQALLSGAQSVILISDGDFNMGSNLIKTVKDTREQLTKLRRQHPMFFMVAVWPFEEDAVDLQRIADILKVQLWIDERPGEVEPEELDQAPF